MIDTSYPLSEAAATEGRLSAREHFGKIVLVPDSVLAGVSLSVGTQFFQGGVAAFEGKRRVGAVGVSGLAGADDDGLARRALAQAGLGDGPR